MYKELITAFRNNDPERALKMTYTPKKVQTAKNDKKIKSYIKLLSRTFSPEIVGQNYEKLFLPRQLLIGDEKVIINAMYFKMNRGKDLFSTLTRFKGDSDLKLWDGYRTKDKYSLSDLYYSVALTDYAIIENHKKVNIASNITTDYEFRLPCSTSENPVYFQFNGTVYNDFDLMNDTPDPEDEVLKFYQKTYQMLANGEYEDVAARHSELSKSLFKKNLKKKKPKISKRKIRFILNADPLYVIFFKGRHGFYHRDHEYVIRSDDKVGFQITHIGQAGSFYHLMTNKKLFREPILDVITGNKSNTKEHAEEKKSVE